MTLEEHDALPDAQRLALRQLRLRHDPPPSHEAFVARLTKEPCGDAIMCEAWGMWIGVEPDGYTHS